MSTAKKLALIAAGYVLAVVGGVAAVAANELFMPADIAQTSPGMVAFGDMILFVLVTGFLGLAPTWFLLRLCFDKSQRTTIAVLLIAAVLGPVSWLAVTAMAVTTTPGGPSLQQVPEFMRMLLGPLIAFGAIPRMVLGPVLLVIEAMAFLQVRGRVTRALLAGATLLDLVPLCLFALHMAGMRS